MEKKSKRTYLTLGIGIGIIIASTFYSFYSQVEYIDLSDDIIMERARDLGMVSLKESISIDSLEEGEVDGKETEKNLGEEIVEVIEEVEVEEVEDIEIVIESGSSLTQVATKLHNTNLIDDKDEFILFVKDKKLDKRIITGRYKIKHNNSYEDIIEILTWRPK